MITERLTKLRKLMAENGIDAYMVPTSDFHESEYVGDYFKCREFITGFTGSAGTAVVTADDAGLWTDGRYFVQAAIELKDSGVTLYKMGEENVPSIEEYLIKKLPDNGVLGFDGRVLNTQMGEELNKALSEKNISFSYTKDLVGSIWTERPEMSKMPVWRLDIKYAGVSAVDKIRNVRLEMKRERADVHILTTLDDIAWLLNIRGNDVLCNPVVLSYVIITDDKFQLFISAETLDDEMRNYLKGVGAEVLPYEEIYDAVSAIKNKRVWVEKKKVNYAVSNILDKSNIIINKMNPTVIAKSMKNPVEVDNIRRAHIKDGVAVTKFIFWLKNNIGRIAIDEVSAADYLEELRKEQEGYLDLSFPTISAYKENAAMCHYEASEDNKKTLEPNGLYLVDSGGHYYEGTTDITRTIALGELTAEEREMFTLIAMSTLRLGHVKFMHGCSGINLDYTARELFWSRGLNFNHGTGHGVGYLLNVHERPNGIRWKMVPERQDNGILEEGMVTSNEPGIYFEGRFGIRTENLVVCKKAEKNEYGQFMEFECLTWVPIDLDAIDVSIMERKDIEYLNEYHRQVYEKISPYLTAEEAEWLKKYTRAV